ncbi:MAG: hypothetical protein PHG06_06780 [Parabacteroides sp.]|nr:hypothetical protein [Parabacteroides sp.]
MAMLLYPLEVTLEFPQDLSDFLTARINSFSPEMIRTGFGEEYKRYEEIKNEITNLYKKLDTLLTPNNRSLLEDFDVQISLAYSMREAFCYKQGLLDGIKLPKQWCRCCKG